MTGGRNQHSTLPPSHPAEDSVWIWKLSEKYEEELTHKSAAKYSLGLFGTNMVTLGFLKQSLTGKMN